MSISNSRRGADATDVRMHENILSAISFTTTQAHLDAIARLKRMGLTEEEAHIVLQASVRVRKAPGNPFRDLWGRFSTKLKHVRAVYEKNRQTTITYGKKRRPDRVGLLQVLGYALTGKDEEPKQ